MNIAQRLGCWLVAGAIAVFCFWPSLVLEFGVHNDYSLWTYDRSESVFRRPRVTHLHPESAHLAAIGRPLGAVLLNVHSHPIKTIADFTKARWFTLVVVLLSAALLARRLQRHLHVPAAVAICAATCVVILPPSQAFLYWVGNFVPGTLNVLLALLTYEALDRVELSGWRGGSRQRIKFVAWLLLAGALFLASMCIYPATTLFILVPTFCCVIFSPLELWPQTRRVVLRDALFAVAGMGAYFALTRFVIRPVLGRLFPAVHNAIEWNQAGLYQLTVERNVLVWIKNLWNVLVVSLDGCLHPLISGLAELRLAWAMTAGLLVAGVWWLVRRPATPGGISSRLGRAYYLQACVAGLALVALAELPVIVPAGASGFVPYRVVYPASAMIILLVFSIVARIRLPFADKLPALVARPLPVMVLLGCAILGHMNLDRASANAHKELAFFREQLRGQDNLRAANGLLVIGPIPGFNFVEGTLKSEFRISATGSPFVHGLADVLLAEKGIQRGEIVVRHFCLDHTAEYAIVLDGTAVVDMSMATHSAKSALSQRPRARVSVSKESYGNALGAFDPFAFGFWEAVGLPQWLQVNYGRPFRLAEYSICASQPADRAPSGWQLLGSNDGTNWAVLDERSNESSWSIFEDRKFALAKPAQFCIYKLLLTSVPSDIVRVGKWHLRHETSVQVASKAKAQTK